MSDGRVGRVAPTPEVRHDWRAATTTIAAVQERVGRFLEARGWQQCHLPKNLAMSIAIEAAELMELYQWVPSEDSDDRSADPVFRERLGEELADVLIYCFSLAHRLGLDVAAVIDDKLVKNGRKYPADKPSGPDGGRFDASCGTVSPWQA
ncbi:MAG TPA: nucleotide pyrophosphohydrolase [Bacillota bacterium]